MIQPHRNASRPRWRRVLHEVIFEADTPAGKAFDLVLIATIILSVVAAMLESVPRLRATYGRELYLAEWIFTILFTIEYVLRWLCVQKPWRYATSFFGIVDLLAVIPTYLDLLVPGTRYLFVIRILRLLRVFRVLKLVTFVGEAEILLQALRASRRKIVVFLFGVATIVVVAGTLIYVLEGEAHGFTNIPISIYWAVVTVTTVGYGDLSPQTSAGQTMAAILMILGYAIIAVPTGIVSVEMAQARTVSTQACPQCSTEGHAPDARFCKRCGAALSWDQRA
jgi:voltage-gated potassium channel